VVDLDEGLVEHQQLHLVIGGLLTAEVAAGLCEQLDFVRTAQTFERKQLLVLQLEGFFLSLIRDIH